MNVRTTDSYELQFPCCIRKTKLRRRQPVSSACGLIAFGLTACLQLLPSQLAIAQNSVPLEMSRGVSNANPFREIDQLAGSSDRTRRTDLWTLVHEAYRRGLYGTSRRFARETLLLDPDFAPARQYLGFQKYSQRGIVSWITMEELARRRQGFVRHPTCGWVLERDLESAFEGLLRDDKGDLVPVGELDAKHNTWTTRRTIETQYFTITSSVPLEVMWYVADDLDKLVVAYTDFFEIGRLSERRFTANLYYTSEDAKAAGAREDLLVRYGAYFHNGTLHVMFHSLGGMTAVRHEAGHALNRAYIRNLPQWLDEGIGVMCQFIHIDPESGHSFGHLPPRHRFGLQFLEEVKKGSNASLAEINKAGHVKTDSHYYSQFRSIVDFCMNGKEKQYRARFLKAVFDNQGTLDELFAIPGIDQEWLMFVRQREADQEWHYLYDPKRAESLGPLLKSGAPAIKNGNRS